jgi:S-formylglutathione hydrolase
MHSASCVERFDLNDPVHGAVPALALLPPLAMEQRRAELPVCLFLYGGGGSHESLLAIEPLLRDAWRDGTLPPLIVGCLGVPPFCFYLDDAPAQHWQSAVSQGLLSAVRSRFVGSARPAGLVGISMGGYGALKIAFEEPSRFAAVAAIAPMVEPSTEAAGVKPRNRFHYPEAVPQRLLGPGRDAALFYADHPVTRARRKSRELREHELAVYIEAGSRDALHAHDGAEFVHRALWQLDIPHEYHLLRDADHVGPTLPTRLLRAFTWVGARLAGEAPEQSDEERALAAYLEPAKCAARKVDPSLDRTYGSLGSECSSMQSGRAL